MTWLALGIPAVVWLIYFVWNLVNAFHKFHKDRSPVIIMLLLFMVSSFAVLLLVEHSTITRLRSVPPSNFSQSPQSFVASWTDEDQKNLEMAMAESRQAIHYQDDLRDPKTAAIHFGKAYVHYYECSFKRQTLWQDTANCALSYGAGQINKSEQDLGYKANEALENAIGNKSSMPPKEAVVLYNSLKNQPADK